MPAPAIFLVAAAVVSDIWPQVYEHVPILTVERVAVVALVVILFNGGIDIGWRRFRASVGPIPSLGVVGRFATAGVLAMFAQYALAFDWTLAGRVGAALAPTDPAVLEGEAGVNDPAGIALMLGLIDLRPTTTQRGSSSCGRRGPRRTPRRAGRRGHHRAPFPEAARRPGCWRRLIL